MVTLGCNEKLFFRVVKTAFNQRRKMLRNSLGSFLAGKTDILLSGRADEPRSKAEQKSEKVILQDDQSPHPFSKLLSQRPEQLSVNDFVNLTNYIEPSQ